MSLMKSYGVFQSSSSAKFSSLEQTSLSSTSLIQQAVYHTCPVRSIDASTKDWYIPSQPRYEKCFNSEELQDLEQMYKTLFPDAEKISLSYFYFENKQVVICGEQYLSIQSRSMRSSAIVAHWPNRNAQGIDCDGKLPLRVGIISSFINHKVTFGSDTMQPKEVYLAHVQWFQEHPRRDFFHSSVIVSSTLFESSSPASFIPVSRITARCAVLNELTFKFDYGEDRVCLAIPLLKN